VTDIFVQEINLQWWQISLQIS